MLIGNENEPIKICETDRNETDSASHGDWNTIKPDNEPDVQNVNENYSNQITTNETRIVESKQFKISVECNWVNCPIFTNKQCKRCTISYS